jgi:predicted transcriptional regulator of viral defense system
MSSDRRNTESLLGIKLVKRLAESGKRIFDIATARKYGVDFGITSSYMPECLYYLRQMGWIFPIKRGLYSLSPIFLSGKNIHEYEIAMFLASPAVISHASAMYVHKLVTSSPDRIFVSVRNKVSLPRMGGSNNALSIINETKYHFIQVAPQEYFGIQQIWLDGVQIFVTNLEKTLVDALIRPRYCGGVAGVSAAFEEASSKLNVEKLINYAEKCDVAVSKRLGWYLEKNGFAEANLAPLLSRTTSSFIRLDPTNNTLGSYNKKWMVNENLFD